MIQKTILDIGYSCLPAGRGICLIIGAWSFVIIALFNISTLVYKKISAMTSEKYFSHGSPNPPREQVPFSSGLSSYAIP